VFKAWPPLSTSLVVLLSARFACSGRVAVAARLIRAKRAGKSTTRSLLKAGHVCSTGDSLQQARLPAARPAPPPLPCASMRARSPAPLRARGARRARLRRRAHAASCRRSRATLRPSLELIYNPNPTLSTQEHQQRGRVRARESYGRARGRGRCGGRGAAQDGRGGLRADRVRECQGRAGHVQARARGRDEGGGASVRRFILGSKH